MIEPSARPSPTVHEAGRSLPSRRAVLRGAVAGAAAMGLPTLLAACTTSSAAPKSGDPVRLNFLHFFTGVLWDNGFKGLTEQFHQANPKITWAGTAVPYPDLQQKLLTLIASGNPPDGTSLSTSTMLPIAYRKVLKPLDPYISSTKLNLSDFYAARLDSAKMNGKFVGFPIDFGTSALYYNKDAFDKAGVGYPTGSWTYDDLLTAAKKLTVDGSGKTANDAGFNKDKIKQWGINLNQAPAYIYYPFHAYNGAEFFDKGMTRTEFGTPESVASLQWFADVALKHHAAPTPTQSGGLTQNGAVHPFTTGMWAMSYNWIGLIAYLQQSGVKVQNWDVAPMPHTPNAKAAVSGQNFVVLNGAKQPDAAWQWIKFMVGESAQKTLATKGVWSPGLKSVAKKYGQPANGKPAHFYDVFYGEVDQRGLAPWWYVPGSDEWMATVTSTFQDVFAGRRTAAAAGASLDQALNPKVKNWRAGLPS